MSATSYVGRQPIFDLRMEPVAYELLFRSAPAGEATGAFPEGHQATARVLVDGIFDIGLERLIEGKPTFVNMTREYLCRELPMPFGPQHFILEVLENIELDDELLAALKSLREEGYRLAMDDISHWRPRLDDFLPLMEFIKVDVLACPSDALPELVKRLRAYPVTLVAEKVETWEMFEVCKDLDFGLFQGFFLERPRVIEGGKIPSNRFALIQTLAKLQDPDAEFDLIEQIIVTDPGLSLKLLRLANSAMYGLRKQVDSIHQVIVFLGMDTIKDWVSLILLSSYTDKPRVLTTTALMRARHCQLLAGRAGHPGQARLAFTAGLFSVLDALLDRPLEEILDSLPITAELRAALLRRDGVVGSFLAAVVALENWDWSAVEASGLNTFSLQESWIEALDWTNGIMYEIGLGPKPLGHA